MITATNDISKETGKTAPARESARAEPAAGSSGSGSFMGVSRAETANLLSALSLAQGKVPDAIAEKQNTLIRYMTSLNNEQKSELGENTNPTAKQLSSLVSRLIGKFPELNAEIGKSLSMQGLSSQTGDRLSAEISQNLANLPKIIQEGAPAGKALMEFFAQTAIGKLNPADLNPALMRQIDSSNLSAVNGATPREQREISGLLNSTVTFIYRNQNSSTVIKPGAGTAAGLNSSSETVSSAAPKDPAARTYLDIFQNRTGGINQPSPREQSAIMEKVRDLLSSAADSAVNARLIESTSAQTANDDFGEESYDKAEQLLKQYAREQQGRSDADLKKNMNASVKKETLVDVASRSSRTTEQAVKTEQQQIRENQVKTEQNISAKERQEKLNLEIARNFNIIHKSYNLETIEKAVADIRNLQQQIREMQNVQNAVPDGQISSDADDLQTVEKMMKSMLNTAGDPLNRTIKEHVSPETLKQATAQNPPTDTSTKDSAVRSQQLQTPAPASANASEQTAAALKSSAPGLNTAETGDLNRDGSARKETADAGTQKLDSGRMIGKDAITKAADSQGRGMKENSTERLFSNSITAAEAKPNRTTAQMIYQQHKISGDQNRTIEEFRRAAENSTAARQTDIRTAAETASGAETAAKTGLFRKLTGLFSRNGSDNSSAGIKTAENPAAPDKQKTAEQYIRSTSGTETPSASSSVSARNLTNSNITAMMQDLGSSLLPENMQKAAKNFEQMFSTALMDSPSVLQWLNYVDNPLSGSSGMSKALRAWASMLVAIRLKQLGIRVPGSEDSPKTRMLQKFQDSVGVKDSETWPQKMLDNLAQHVDSLHNQAQNSRSENNPWPFYLPLPTPQENKRENCMTLKHSESDDNRDNGLDLRFYFEIPSLGAVSIRANYNKPDIKLSATAESYEGYNRIRETLHLLKNRFSELGLNAEDFKCRRGSVLHPSDPEYDDQELNAADSNDDGWRV